MTRPRIYTLLAALAVAACGTSRVAEGPVRQVINPSSSLPFSEVVRAGDTYYFSGKIGVTRETRAMTEGRTAAEVRNVMDSFAETFSALGLDFDDVVKATIYLADIGDYDELNEAYAGYFTSDPPAREALAVKELVAGATVEISLVAVRSP